MERERVPGGWGEEIFNREKSKGCFGQFTCQKMFDTRLYEAHIPSALPTSRLFKSPFLSFSLSLTQTQALRFISLFLSIFLSLKDFESLSLRRKIAKSPCVFLSLYSLKSELEEMAQRTEKEETEFKVPEKITLCVNKCGVIGNPATNNMCQKCFNATTTATTTTTSTTTNLKFSGENSSSTTSSSSRPSDRRSDTPAENSRKTTADSLRSEEEAVSAKRVVNRCSGCRRKVGLTGFRCRCGELFCAEHRYTDRHDCSYDYKSVGREAIARENPVVKAAKIVRV